MKFSKEEVQRKTEQVITCFYVNIVKPVESRISICQKSAKSEQKGRYR